MAVFDNLVQDPIEFLPRDAIKDTCMDVEEEVKTASDNRITVEPVKPMSPKEVVACMKLPANAKDKAALEKVILDNITAFSSSDSDLGNFTEWKATLK